LHNERADRKERELTEKVRELEGELEQKEKLIPLKSEDEY